MSDYRWQKNQQVSAYLKLFGSELKFVHFKKSDIQQMVKDIDELMQRKKQEIKYPKFGTSPRHARTPRHSGCVATLETLCDFW